MTVEEWLGKDNKLGQDIWQKKYRAGDETFDEWLDRVSGGDAEVRKLIEEKKFLFGGRVLANRGIKDAGNFYNCFSSGYVEDSYPKIMDRAKEIGITFKIQGGQGLSLTKLRPKGSPIGENYHSDGIIPFMKIFNQVAESTSQGNARRGALLMSIDAKHKEAMDFITIKTDLKEINKANLSLEIDDEFMEAVKKYYETGEVVVLHMKENYSGHEVEWDVTPIELYKKIIETNYNYGEPGAIFTNRARNYNLMEFDENYQIVTTNPCGEQTLMAKTCCNLGSLNLYEFVNNKFTDKAEFDFQKFDKAVCIACNALDEIIDENAERIPEALKEYADNALAWRNIGLGVFNYAHMLMALGLKYGSSAALDFTQTLFANMLNTAVENNIERGEKYGSFPMFNKEKIKEASILSGYNASVILGLRKNITAFRNCSLLSIAPTGTISNLLQGSGGTEPEFALSYTRRTDNLDAEYKIDSNIVKEYRRITGDTGPLPDYFVGSADIKWKDRIDTQAVIQKYVDTAISSTVNLPKETKIEEMEQLYLYAWQKGLKGVTVFRDGCARQGILTTEKTETKSEEPLTIRDLPRGCVIKTSDDGLIGKKKTIISGCGTTHVTAWFDNETGDLLETFFDKGSTGGCMSFMCGLSRQISLAARGGVSVDQIVDQLESTLPCPSYVTRTATTHNTSSGTSCPQAIGRALKSMHKEVLQELGIEDEPVAMPTVKQSDIHDAGNKPKCPECGAELIFEGGCNTCKNCGWSKCG